MTKQISKSGQRLFAILLAVVLLFSVMPISANAVTTNDDGYIEVKTIQDLYNIRLDLTAKYILMNDIDLTAATAEGGDYDYDGRGWNPIGSNDIYGDGEFSGIFDGNGYSIKSMRINLHYSNLPSGVTEEVNVGLFSNVSGTIKNLHMENVDFYTIVRISSGKTNAGGIAAKTTQSATIINCSVTGKIATDDSYDNAGGLIGYNDGTINQCYNTANVSSYYAGGIAGRGGSVENTITKNCYNTGLIIGTNKAGGIVGSYDYYGDIANCYNTGSVRTSKTADTNNGYAIGRISRGTISNCYYLNSSGKGVTGATSLTEAQMKMESMYSGFDFDDVWVINEYANHPYPQLTNNIQDLNETVSLIRVIAYPAKLNYLTGDQLNMVGGMFEAVYISGKTDLLSISEDMITGYNPETIGKQTLTVTYGGKTDTFDITVTKRPEATNVELISQPNKTEFVVGTKFDFTGAKIKVTYDDGNSDEIDVTLDMTSGANINHMGTQTVQVTVDGHSVTFEIKVVPASISGIAITKKPTKLIYLEGEQLDTTGMEIIANYSNGSEIKIASGYAITGYKPNVLGEQTITVDFVGKTASFTVTVKEKSVTNIEIQKKPNKLDYVVGESLDLSGMVVVAAYETGELDIITDYSVSGFDGKAGTKVITVVYKGKSASFTVNVAIVTVTKLTITQLPVKLAYIENEALNTEGLLVNATYNDGTNKNVTDYEIVGFSSLPGVHTLYVMFGGQVATFQITVSAKELSDLRVVKPTKTAYAIGEEFNSTGMKVIACYNNGQEIEIDSYTMTGFDSLSAGAKEIVITYGGITRKFAVTVTKKSVVETGGSIKVGTLKARLGETVEVPVSISKNTGVTTMCHTVTFNSSALKFVGVTAKNGFANGTVVVNDEKAASGKVTIVWFQAADVVESNVAYTLKFEILESAEDGMSDINIAFDNNDNGNASGEDVIFEAVNGGVEVLSYWLGDLNGDRKYGMADLLQLAQYVSGKEMTLTDKQKKSADVNEDGVIDVHDITLLSQWLLTADM